MYKSTKCNYFPFVSILRELAATWKSAMRRGEREASGGKNEGLEALKWLFTNEYGSVSFCHTLVTHFQWLRPYAAFLLKWSAENGIVFINPIWQ